MTSRFRLTRNRREPLPLSDEEEAQQQRQLDNDDDYHNNNISSLSLRLEDFATINNDDITDTTTTATNNNNHDSGIVEEDVDGIFHASFHSTTNNHSNHNNNNNRSHRSLTDYIQEQITKATSNKRRNNRCGVWCCRCIHFCNTFAVTILIIAVGYLFVQIQVLKSNLIQEEHMINELQQQIQQQHISQQTLNKKVDAEKSFTIYQLAGTFTLLTCLITMFHMTQHLNNWYEPVVQRKIIAILWMSPIYSITSWLSLVFGVQADGYLSIINNVYEAYVIYTFLSFLIAVLGRGNRNVAIQVLAKHSYHLKEPTKIFTTCYHPPPYVSSEAKANAILIECTIYAMQFVLIRPFTSILRFVAETISSSDDDSNNNTDNSNNNNWAYFESPMFIIDMITNVSVFFAFHGLLKFYHSVHHDLQWCQPFNKFVSIKSIVFLTFWQGLLISILCGLNEEEKQNQQHSNNIIYNITSISTTSSAITTNDNVDSEGGVITNILQNGTRFLMMRLLNDDNGDDNNNILDLGHELMNFTDNEVNHIDTWINTTMMSGAFDSNDPASPEYNNNTLIDYHMGNSSKPNHTTSSSSTTSGGQGSSSNNTFASHTAREQAVMIQSFLICLEMLFFSIAHWCVFPAEEWQPEYRPKKFASPGIGLKDFASDISYIVSSSSSARAYHKQQRKLQREQQRQLQEESTQQPNNNDSLDSYDDDDDDPEGVEDNTSVSFHSDFASSQHDLQLYSNDALENKDDIGYNDNDNNNNNKSPNPMDIIQEDGHESESCNSSLHNSSRPLMESCSSRRYHHHNQVVVDDHNPRDDNNNNNNNNNNENKTNMYHNDVDDDDDDEIVHVPSTKSIVTSPSKMNNNYDEEFSFDPSNLPALT